MGDGLSAAEIFRAGRPRGGRGSAAPAIGRPRQRRVCSAPSTSATPDWLAFFMFTFFTDRDGKMQLHALSQSGFDPLSRTCRFMLTEEAHHMFVGQSGVGRIIERTCAAMRGAGIDDPTDVVARPRARRCRPADDPEAHQPAFLARRSTCSATMSAPMPPTPTMRG